MVAKPEDCRAGRCGIGAQAFEDAQAVMQRVGQDMGTGFAPGLERAIEPDPAVAVGHCHLSIPFSLIGSQAAGPRRQTPVRVVFGQWRG